MTSFALWHSHSVTSLPEHKLLPPQHDENLAVVHILSISLPHHPWLLLINTNKSSGLRSAHESVTITHLDSIQLCKRKMLVVLFKCVMLFSVCPLLVVRYVKLTVLVAHVCKFNSKGQNTLTPPFDFTVGKVRPQRTCLLSGYSV